MTAYQRHITRVMVLIALFHGIARGEESEWTKRFNDHWARAQAEELKENWVEAARHYQAVVELSCERELGPWDVLRDLARCQARMGKTDEALESLFASVELGLNDANGLEGNPAFGALREDDRFKRILARARAVDQERILIYAPEKIDAKKPAPLVVFFHGLGDNPHGHLPFWKKVADKMRLIVALPRGVHRPSAFHTNFNTWHDPPSDRKRNTSDIDAPACLAVVDEAIEMAKKKYKLRNDRIILAGYSQGGIVALRLLAEHPDRFAGAVVMGTLYKPTGAAMWEAAGAAKKKRVYLLSGELDALAPQSVQAQRELQAAGVDAKLVHLSGVGHEPPKDYLAQEIDGMRFVLRLKQEKARSSPALEKPG